ncbi:GTP cyclohydrolase FolE2 [Metabacillus sediminilitoris]|uniref:GTP cyclohydrolase FolE2 n=1 Tax=Metabacillus sediminilitoris TaxID=2567941 RepID=A0A4S4C4F0_9BACI|nr:GTP cyclohydrolase FolE2 [Metabacillus sediminilitoris]QGQ47623.1 GTP cyclohydrolase I FolE2 [Metabacillus sediminilitoris]THF82057.1 GTP cyclohydrolase I FolE2 [Metabacillus sediminilitoris]
MTRKINLPPKKERHKLFGSVEPGVKLKPIEKDKMPDLQNTKKDFLFTIDAVGISNVKHPVIIKSELNPQQQTTIANVKMTSKISHDAKGTNMSRFTEQLEKYRQSGGFVLTCNNLFDFTKELAERLKQKDASIEMTFPWFYERKGPSSELIGLNHADAKLTVSFEEGVGFKTSASLTCAVTTLCPCSKEISEYSAHNQRGYVTMHVEFTDDYRGEKDWKAALLHAAESNASAMIHPVLKRPDEKMVTETAYENPRFVEDMVRLVAADLYELEFVQAFTVECRNEESIHLHDAIASLSYRK